MNNHDPDTPAPAACPCHDAVACPDQATIAVNARELTRLGQLLAEVDEFLRCGTGVTGLLAGFYAARGQAHPGFAAGNLVDAVSLAAASRLLTAPGQDRGGEQ